LRAYIVVDLGFGDTGKGLLTDFLVRRFQAGIVVRYNGGAQAGHNVVTSDGRQHTFSQFGSGTFVPGVKTYLSRHVVVHPGALLLEGDILASKGVPDAFSRLRVSEQALIITPFHQAANRMRELARRADRHGSCGVGVGEAVEDGLLHPEERVLAGDLSEPTRLRRKLLSIRDWEHDQLAELCKDNSPGPAFAREWELFESQDVIDAWIASMARIGELGLVTPDSALERGLRETETAVFEGAQGVLLDADAGFHPFTTWSCCTAANAIDLIKEMTQDSNVCRIGVMRSYALRHGPGPLPTETDELTPVISEHNRYNEWQGAVRYGWFDAVLARYALDVTAGVDCLAVTYLDVLSHLEIWKYCPGYTGWHAPEDTPVDAHCSSGVLTGFHLPPGLALAQRQRFTRALAAVTPVLETCGPDKESVLQKIGSLLGKPVDIISSGPSAGNVQIPGSIPS
jgi:adenylosuccinate synthase